MLYKDRIAARHIDYKNDFLIKCLSIATLRVVSHGPDIEMRVELVLKRKVEMLTVLLIEARQPAKQGEK